MARKVGTAALPGAPQQKPFMHRLGRDLSVNRELYLLFIPVAVYYILFHYMPMYGAVIAFQNYKPALGISGSSWVGLKHFRNFFNGYYFGTLMRNTLVLSFTNLLAGFPVPILLALLINELRSRRYARVVQTITYMPHFISLVVVCSMVREFTKSDGLVTTLLSYFGFPRQTMLNNPNLFVPVYVISSIWQEAGWGSIIYLSALTGIDPTLYEAAEIDGASSVKRFFSITLPCLSPIILFNLIMQLISGFMTFTQAQIITQGGPNYATNYIALNIFQEGFAYSHMGYACAQSWVMLLIMAAITGIIFKTSDNWAFYES